MSSINSLNASSSILGPAPLTPPGYVSSFFSPPKERGKGVSQTFHFDFCMQFVVFSTERKFPTTPPAKRKQLINNATLLTDSFPLTKSKSHESQLAETKGKNGEIGNIK